jgi:hypothetical protein
MCQRLILASNINPPPRQAASGGDRLHIPRSRALSRFRKAAVGTSIVDGFDLDLNFRYSFSAFIAIGPLSAH